MSMLPRGNRIDKKAFPHVFNEGKRFFGLYVTLYLLETPHEKKFSFVVPKKVESGAFKRNSLRRRYRGFFEHMFENVASGYSGIFVLKDASKQASKDDLAEDLKKTLQKAHILG